jgi:hypothetical protein
VRVYLPATLTRLEQWLGAGAAQLDPDGVGCAVTPTLREWYYAADADELEHVAQLAAAAESLALLAADPAAPRRRVVIAADVDDAAISFLPERGRAAVAVRTPTPLARWGSALVDDAGAEPVVVAAVGSLGAAAAGDDDAQFALDEAEAYELGWYAVQELRHLLAP